jgi:hypothetical protein
MRTMLTTEDRSEEFTRYWAFTSAQQEHVLPTSKMRGLKSRCG